MVGLKSDKNKNGSQKRQCTKLEKRKLQDTVRFASIIEDIRTVNRMQKWKPYGNT